MKKYVVMTIGHAQETYPAIDPSTLRHSLDEVLVIVEIDEANTDFDEDVDCTNYSHEAMVDYLNASESEGVWWAQDAPSPVETVSVGEPPPPE